ncbi:MAG: TIGR04552 family protein, partial [Deltaproteobacteria bacterium]|nr:TIGR04552 family protein [Deltaproteobacteria bacterium]
MPLQFPVYRQLEELRLLDVENLRLVLSGNSVIDWRRLDFESAEEVREFLWAHGFDVDDPASQARMEEVKNQAIAYLARNFGFSVPKPVAEASIPELILMASGKGHRQLCACTILKVVHVIHHLEARELLSMLPISDQDLFQLVEQKVYRMLGGMLAHGLPIVEFVGGRKNKDSLYTKLLSKRETHAAEIYDKLRFKVVVREQSDVLPVLAFLLRHLFPFNYTVPGESKNTLIDFPKVLANVPQLASLLQKMQPLQEEPFSQPLIDNVFSAPNYRVVHFVTDVPVRVPDELLENAPPPAWSLGKVVFAKTELQIVDRETDIHNEIGEASHEAY